jgi:zinc transporter ZupT
MRKIGIIVADDGELAPFVEKLENADNIGYFGRSCYTFEVGGNTVILTHSGIGKVNAAAAAMFLHFNGCDTIFNYGYSGGISGVSKGSIVIADKFLDKLMNNKNDSKKRSILLVTAVTLHNIPEGLAVGVAFGGVLAGIPEASVISACLLAIGIAMQNLPEGAAIALPLRREGYSIKKCLFYGQASGIVEPIAGVLGALLAIKVQSILPFLLAFSAGSMIGVVGAELIPESTKNHKNTATIGLLLGFMLMMILDVALG